MTVDILITGGTVINGRDFHRKANVGIKGEKIVYVGQEELSARKVIQAQGKIVVPGFIDTHSHNDFILTRNKVFRGKITQGITTEVIGNCGISAAPYSSELLPFIRQQQVLIGHKGKVQDWCTWERYFQILKSCFLVTNIVPLVGHGNLKKMAEFSAPAGEIITFMKKLIVSSMEKGISGLSTGLIYDPGVYSSTEEIIELAKIVKNFGGIYATHIRGEGRETLLSALKEAITIGQQTSVGVQISHLKLACPAGDGKTELALRMLEKARSSGLDITYDQYPYTAASTSLSALLPPWAKKGGWSVTETYLSDRAKLQQIKKDLREGLPGWENYSQSVGWQRIIISQVRQKKNRWMEGQTVEKICQKVNQEPVDFVLHLLLEERGCVGMIYYSMQEKSVEFFLREKIGFIGTDGLPGRRPHPRLWGSFPRFLNRYVLGKKLLTLEEAVEKMSRLPAKKFNLKGRGEIQEGNFADIVVFDSQRVKDRASYRNPQKSSSGIEWVLVNGQIVLQQNRFTGLTPGKILLRS